MVEKARWTAILTYRSKKGPDIRTFYFEEFRELGSEVEHGPHWDTVVSIQVMKTEPSGLTLEKAIAGC